MPLTRKLASKSLIKQNTNQDVIGTGVTNLVRDAFTGTGSQTVFTLTTAPLSAANTQVFISGVYQNKNTYTVVGTTLTFSTAPPNSTLIEVISGTNYSIGVPGDGTVTTAKINSTGATSGSLLIANGSGGVSFTNLTPTIQRFTSGSGTYNAPANVKYIKVRMVGGGGGGQGSVTSAWAAAGGNGSSTTFGAILTAPGGSGGNINIANGGSAPTISLPAITIASFAGMNGFSGQAKAAGVDLSSGAGGATPFSGAGAAAVGGIVGFSAIANSGSGGSGAGMPVGSAGSMGQGGGAGSYIEALIQNPSLTYSYSIGTGGAGGAAGSGGSAGGAGGDGIIIVEEYYQ
jgi:hypothetical protein